MYVITVDFRIKPGEESRFLERMRQQARESREREAGCLHLIEHPREIAPIVLGRA